VSKRRGFILATLQYEFHIAYLKSETPSEIIARTKFLEYKEILKLCFISR